MTTQILPFYQPMGTLFLTLPNTDFARYCLELDELVRAYPEILERIRIDLEKDGLRKKVIRQKDKKWRLNQEMKDNDVLFKIPSEPKKDIPLKLEQGRRRMDSYVAYIFMMGRGYYGGIKSRSGETFTGESRTLQFILESKGLQTPSESSVYDNINAISNETREFILNCQMKQILKEGLDNFDELTIDSTSVSGNVSWPRDSNIITRVIERAFNCGKKLEVFGAKNILDRYFPRLIREINRLSKKINMESGKKDSKKKRRKYYRRLLKLSGMAEQLFEEEFKKVISDIKWLNMKPSQKEQLDTLVEMIKTDIDTLKTVRGYCYARIIDELTIPSKDKVMSLSDDDAAYIQKGDREAVVGYKPQLVRSKNGFISSLTVPKGNASDSAQFGPAIDKSIAQTGIIPTIVSADDGYVNTAERDKLLTIGVSVVSFSGSKGKNLLSEEEWNSDAYIKTRNNRSAVESLMYTIKHNFDFDRVVRRGHKNVAAELLEKAIAYNFCRLFQIREKLNPPLPLAA